ncbi:hypothetical protein [Thiomonas intermedia]|uniref:hypothetical protein n=1 Tax=Thiomonas intermedia TaxID=926 RepID=UPI0009A5273E|nr:hypothetical protein [Thiomonas intermedia]
MKTLLRWLGLVLSLIAARVLIALAILAGVLFLIDAGLQSLGLPMPTQQEIAQRLQPALQELGPVWQRVHGAVAPPAATNSAPAPAAAPAQNPP